MPLSRKHFPSVLMVPNILYPCGEDRIQKSLDFSHISSAIEVMLPAPSFAHSFGVLGDNSFDLQYSIPMTQGEKNLIIHDYNIDTNFEDELELFNNTGTMAGTGNSSPFIKDEPEDYTFPAHNFAPAQREYGIPIGHPFGDGTSNNVDPSELTMQNGSFGPFHSGSQQNMTSSYNNLGNLGIDDEELLDLDLNDVSTQQTHFSGGQHGFGTQGHGNMQHFYADHGHPNGQSQMGHIYSSTPDGAPIQSPFVHENFTCAQFGVPPQLPPGSHTSSHMHASLGNPTSLDHTFMNVRSRPKLPQKVDRRPSDSRSPMTPKTPGLGGLTLGTSDAGSVPSQPIHTNFNQHRHQKNPSNQWDNTPGSVNSYIDTPLSSPGHPASHAQISEILKSGKHASLPTKVENSVPAYHAQEAKRRRRRESHNMVERRRRDNINERIQELSHLVPLHRLEDEKVRKHMMNNSPLSPSLAATGRSPPPATSLLAGGGRRAAGAGSISLGIPVEEKDKGPNKGDILNGAVSWTRDLMWALDVKIQQEAELADIITSLGGRFPFEQTEDEKRMRTELLSAMTENDPGTFSYTRGPGSGLRVPNHTTVSGESLNPDSRSPPSLSPGVQPGGSGASSGGPVQPHFWDHNGERHGFKEEDEYGMDMN